MWDISVLKFKVNNVIYTLQFVNVNDILNTGNKIHIKRESDKNEE